MSDTPPTLYCANHPQTETTLRCNRCEKPICVKCAVLTPTGYRCIECVRGQQKIFETAQWFDYPLAFVIAGALSYLGSRFIPVMGFFTIFISPIAGVIIAEVIRFAVRKRRSRRLLQVSVTAAVLGSSPLLLLVSAGFLGGGLRNLMFLLPLVWQALYTFTVASTVYYRLGGIQINR